MTPSTLTLDVAGLPVTAAVIHHRLEVPMRCLIVDTLGMAFGPQAKKLKRLAARFQVRPREITIGDVSGSEPCLPAHRLTAYLWTLAPRRPEVREKLALLQDGFDTALLAWHGVNTDDLDGPGSWLARVVAGAPRSAALAAEDLRVELARTLREVNELQAKVALSQREADDLRTQNAGLKQAFGEANTPQTVRKVMTRIAAGRWQKKAMSKETFLEMARLHDAGNSLTEIARQMGCSHTAVALFLDGKYNSANAQAAWKELIASGWLRGVLHAACNSPLM
jgi:regulator of replication initiation timing